MIRKKRDNKAQIWIETVIYTVIGLTIIASMMYIILPKINQMNDKAIISQSIDSLNVIDTEIQNLLISPANKREVILNVKKGEYTLDGVGDKIFFILKGTELRYSEVNETIVDGEIFKVTRMRGERYDVYLFLNYSYINITFEDKEINKTLTSASTSYRLLFENLGAASGNLAKVNVKLI
jgi:hypothetical protein